MDKVIKKDYTLTMDEDVYGYIKEMADDVDETFGDFVEYLFYSYLDLLDLTNGRKVVDVEDELDDVCIDCREEEARKNEVLMSGNIHICDDCIESISNKEDNDVEENTERKSFL